MEPEQLARYHFALPAAGDAEVLDLGFSTGHGAELMATRAARVVAVEDRAVLVSAATARFAGLRDVLAIVQAGPAGLPLADARFDLVCCFELLRWGADGGTALAEIRRVLRATGCCVVACDELAPNELETLLAERFAAVRIFEQRGFQSESFREYPSQGANVGAVPEDSGGSPRGLLAIAGPSAESLARFVPRVVHLAAAEPPGSFDVPGELVAQPFSPLSDQMLRDAESEIYERGLSGELWRQAATLAGSLQRELLAARDLSLACPEERGSYDLLIPTYNSPEITARCIDSLIAHTNGRHRIWLIDDASPDPKMDPMLASYAERHERIEYFRLPKNLGFPGAVNAGLERTERDVVLINSDTEFPPGWLARLDRCRHSHGRIGAISPLSNNATICSVPRLNEKNALPDGMSVEQMDRLVQETTLRRYPRTPTVVGFCMLMTREALTAVGKLDTAFGRGYGEEVDWCQKAWKCGFESVLCDDLYVYHHGEVGFSHVKKHKELQQANEQLLARRWPRYHTMVATYCLTNPLRLQQQRLLRELEQQAAGRLRVLHVAHSYDAKGGTELFLRGLLDALRGRAHNTLYLPQALPRTLDAHVVREASGDARVSINVQAFPLEYSLRGALVSLRSRNAERLFAEVVLASGARVVHFSHLANLGSLALPVVARALGVRVVIVLHDYFLLCPDWNLLDQGHRACGKDKVDLGERCQECIRSKLEVAERARTPNTVELLRERSAICRASLEAADVLVAPSKFVKAQFRRAWGDALAERIVVIPHGTRPTEGASHYEPQPRLRVAFLGSATREKGRDVFFEAAASLAGSTVNFRVIGALGPESPAVPSNVSVHGVYDPESLPQLLQDVDVVVIASTWHETYCYTVDEAYRAGVPVIATTMGAIQERVQHGRTGLLIPPSDAVALAAAIRRLDDDRALLATLRRGVGELVLKTRQQNFEEYAALFVSEGEMNLSSELIRKGMEQSVAQGSLQQPLRESSTGQKASAASGRTPSRGAAYVAPKKEKKRSKRRKGR